MHLSSYPRPRGRGPIEARGCQSLSITETIRDLAVAAPLKHREHCPQYPPGWPIRDLAVAAPLKLDEDPGLKDPANGLSATSRSRPH